MLFNRSIPQCTVIPELSYPDIGEAITWLRHAFGLALRLRIANHRAQLTLGDGAVVLIERGADLERSSLLIRVENADDHCQRAKAGGAKILRPLTDYPYGERQYTAEDYAGHRWTFSQSIADVAPADWGGELAEPSA